MGFAESPQPDFDFGVRLGLDVETMTTRRFNQGFFREMILASYESKCAITGVEAKDLLVASHIVPWAANADSRTDPHNGLCLNYLHDRAFELGFIAIEPDLSIIYSPQLPSEAARVLRAHAAPKLKLPHRFHPSPAFLAEHRKRFRA